MRSFASVRASTFSSTLFLTTERPAATSFFATAASSCRTTSPRGAPETTSTSATSTFLSFETASTFWSMESASRKEPSARSATSSAAERSSEYPSFFAMSATVSASMLRVGCLKVYISQRADVLDSRIGCRIYLVEVFVGHTQLAREDTRDGGLARAPSSRKKVRMRGLVVLDGFCEHVYDL